MAFIGNVPAESYITTVKDTFSGNASDTEFTLSQPTLTNDVRVVVENVVQEPTTAYSVAGTTLTFTSAPPSGTNNVYVIHLGPAVQTTVPPDSFGISSIFGAGDTDTRMSFEGSGVTTFDQNGSEAARFDASGNLLVSKTSANTNTAGVEARADGLLAATKSGAKALNLNRLTDDGDIVAFQKDGTKVGSIGVTNSGVNAYYAGGSGKAGVEYGNDTWIPWYNGSRADNTVNLGMSTNRFKDLYLSGGVYLGGTGAANYIEDYEEGTWTATITTTGTDFTTASRGTDGWYTKVGNLVTAHCGPSITSPTSGTGDLIITGLPFTSTYLTVSSFVRWGRVDLPGSFTAYGYVSTAGNTIAFEYSVSGAAATALTAADLNGNITPFLSMTISYVTS